MVVLGGAGHRRHVIPHAHLHLASLEFVPNVLGVEGRSDGRSDGV